MKAGEVVFQKLLDGKLQYRVPLFQRTYSWKEIQWELLWENILEIYALEPRRSHFIGAIVTMPMPDSPELCAKFMLIDGQQRFTTLLILLSVIRDAAKKDAKTATLAEEIYENCLINKYVSSAEELEKLKPTQQDMIHFANVIAGQSSDKNTQIGQAIRYFEKKLADGDSDLKGIDLRRLKDCVTQYLSIVSITLDQGDSPHRIFESLNNAGLRLSASDLVRNHIFMQIKSEKDQISAYEKNWLPMQNRLEPPENNSYLSDFFWRYLMRDGDQPRQDDVYEHMKTWIDKQQNDKKTIIEVLEELNRYSCHYANILMPDKFEPSKSVKRGMNRLNQWEVEVAYPFLLEVHEHRLMGIIDETIIVEILGMIESYVVRRIVCGIPTNRLRRIFGLMARNVDKRKYVESSRAYLQSNEWPIDSIFKERFQSVRLYIPSRLARTRLILSSLEDSFGHKEPVDTSQSTIEHIMPQTLNPEWEKHLGANCFLVHEKYLHTIGNLTFTGYNSELGNMEFSKKKEIYNQSHYELNREIIKKDKWTEDEIIERAKDLATRALSIWKR